MIEIFGMLFIIAGILLVLLAACEGWGIAPK